MNSESRTWIYPHVTPRARARAFLFLSKGRALRFIMFFQRHTQKGVLVSYSYQEKQLVVQGKDNLTYNDTKKIKLH
jgi:hypothetical protein